jgi:autotransporter translocation and assembly factor TamB
MAINDQEREVVTGPRRRGVGRRIARIAGWTIGLPLALGTLIVCLAILYARTDRGRETLRKLALAEARKSVPGLQIGAIGGDYLHELTLRDVELRDDRGRPAVRVAAISARYNLAALLARTVSVRELRIEGVAVEGRPDERGGLNLARLTAPAQPTGAAEGPASPSAWRVHVDRIVVGGVTGSLELPDGRQGTVGDVRFEGGVRIDRGDLRANVDTLSITATWDTRAYALSAGDISAAIGSAAIEARVPALSLTGLLPDGAPIDLRAEVAGPRDRIAGKVEIAAGAAGDLRVDGRAGLVGDERNGTRLGEYDVTLALSDLDPARIDESAPSGSIDLRLHASGRGLVPAPDADAAITFEILPSRVGGIDLQASRVAASIDGDRWEIPRTVAVRAKGAALTIAGRGTAGHVVGDAAIDLDGRLARLSRDAGVGGRGHVELHAEGDLPDRVAVSSRGALSGVRAGTLRLGALRLTADARIARDRPSDVKMKVGARDVVLAPNAPKVDSFTLDAARSGAGVLTVRAAVAGPRLRGGLRAHGTATAAAADFSLDAASLDVTTLAYRQKLDLERPARIRYRARDEIAVEHLAIRGAGARFTGEAILDGTYRLPPSRRDPLAAVTIDLRGASAGGLPPTDGHLDARLTRRRASVRFDAAMPAVQAQLHLDADVPVEIARDGTPALAVHGNTVVHLKSNKVRLQAIPAVERQLARQGITGGTASLDLTITGDIAHPDAKGTFDVRDVMYRNIAGLGRDSTLKTVPGLGGSLVIDARPGSMKLGARLLIRNTGVLEADLQTPVDLGKIIAGADVTALPFKAAVNIPRFRLASLADFTDGFKGVQGELYGQVEVSGTGQRPSGRAHLAIDNAQVDKVQFRQVALDGEGDKGRLAARVALRQVTGGQLDGSLSVERSQRDRLRAYVTGKDLDVGFLRLFLTNVRELAGIAQLSMTAEGSVAAPRFRASLSVDKGRVGVTGQPTFQDVRLNATLEPGRADLHRIQMRSGGGTLEGKGWALLGGAGGLSPRSTVFTAHAHRFLVAAAGSTGARIDGDVAVNAALREDVLSGKVEIPDANVWLPKGPTTGGGRDLQKIGPHADVHFVDQTAIAAAERDREKKRQAAAEALKLAVRATAKPVYIRGKDLDLEVRSDIRIGTVPSGPHAGAPTISGGIHIPRGRINVQGQRFDFEHGHVTFNGSSEIDPELDLKLTRQYPEALVVIELRGTPRKPQLRMSSDPAVYDQAQIVSLILTGQPGGQPSTGKSFDPTAAVTTAVLSKLADKVAPALGLDVMRVEGQEVKNEKGEATGDTDTRVEVGKYVTERIYMSYAHVFGAPDNANQNEAHVEYRMTRRLVMETVFGDAGQGGLDTLWTYRF